MNNYVLKGHALERVVLALRGRVTVMAYTVTHWNGSSWRCTAGLAPSTSPSATWRHKCIGHNYIDHNYIGHGHAGHSYGGAGHHTIGHLAPSLYRP